MSGARSSTMSVESLVFDFLVSASDTIVQERRGICNPIAHSSASYSDSADFCRQSLQPWKRDLSKPLILDMYIFDPRINKHILMERWKFYYQRANDLKDTRFNLLNLSPKLPTISFQLYEQKSTYPTGFVNDNSSYRFEPVSTSKGLILVSVKFATQSTVKEVLTNVNGGAQINGVPSSGHSRRNSKTGEEAVGSAAIPIPSKDTAADSREREPANGKHVNARLVAPSSSYDPTAENSSAGSTGTLGSAPGILGSTPPLGNRSSTRTSGRDPHRRSFQLPSHAEYVDMHSGGGAQGGGEDVSEAVRAMQRQHNPSSGQRSGAGAGVSGGQAVSFDSYANGQYLNRLAAEGGGGVTSRPGSFRMQPGQGVDAYGVKIGNPAQQQQQQAPSTSYGNSYSQNSTPPFSLGELAAQQAERYSGAYPELTQGSPPYPAFSASLTSTSPYFGSNMLALIEKRKGSYGAGQGREHPHYPIWRQGADGAEDMRSFMFKGGRLSPTTGMDFSEMKLKIPQLPSSPFVHMSHGRAMSDDGKDSTEDIHVRGHSTALVPSRQGGGSWPERRDSRTQRGAPDSPRESDAAMEDNTLDAVRMMESQRMSLENADGLDLYAFRASLDSNPGVRLPSKDRSSSGTEFEEDLPFAWAESEIGASVAHLPAASDSIGAQLVYGLSKMNLQGGGPGGAGAGAGRGGGGGEGYPQRQQGQAGYADTGRGLGLGLGNSTYTGAGLSGELQGKINEFKHFSAAFAK